MNEFRSKSIDLFINIFENDAYMCQFPEDTLEWVAREIESGCHSANIDKAINKNVPRYWEDIGFQEQYSSIVYKVAINIDPNSSVNKIQPPKFQRFLIKKIYTVTMLVYFLEIAMMNNDDYEHYIKLNDPAWTNVIELRKIGYMDSDSLNPHINEPYIQQIKLRSKQYVEEKTSTMYPCPQCKARNARCRQLQTRSGDEGYTLFLTCKPCGNLWRIYG